MRYGVCTWTFGDTPLPTIVEKIAALGFDGVELFGDLTLDPVQVRTLLASQDLEVLSTPPQNVDICHPHTAVRETALAYYLDLLDFAAAVGAPLIACHGAVGRISAISSYEEEWALYVEAVQRIAGRARELGLGVVMEILNRYESHLLVTAAEGQRFLAEVSRPNVRLLLDTYHMNIEEPDLAAAVWQSGDRLGLFHVADSNRQAVGRGHTDFPALLRALHGIRYQGDVILELTPPGPDPFTPHKGPDSVPILETYLSESLRLLKHYTAVATDSHSLL